MNIYRREMKAHRWGLLFWCLGMLFLVMSGMAKYAAYKGAGQSVAEIMAGIPKSMQVIFGLSGFDLTKASGFYGILFLYMAVMAAVHAVLLGASVIAEEERDKTSEFLYREARGPQRRADGQASGGAHEPGRLEPRDAGLVAAVRRPLRQGRDRSRARSCC